MNRNRLHPCAAVLFLLAAIHANAADAPAPASAANAGPAANASTGRDLLHQLDDAFTGVYEKVAPAVVIVEAGKKPGADEQDQGFEFYFHSPESEDSRHPSGEQQQQLIRSEGSGFIVRPDGYIYTNYHVVADSEEIEVRLRDKRRFKAKIVGADDRTDIAVLKIEARDLPTVTMADSDSVRIGQLCFAIGIPYNLDYSFSGGYVAAKGRSNLTSTPAKPMYEDYIQTDAFINPGNSGGPLFDVDGRIMGMNTLINGIGRGLAFAIPSNMLRDVGEELIATGKVTRPWLGVRILNLADNPALSDHFRGVSGGVYVDTIEADAPAYKSDLRPYDVITKVDGVTIGSARDLQHEILKKKVGETVALDVWRGGKYLTVSVQTGKLPDDFSALAAAAPSRSAGNTPSLGFELQKGGESRVAALAKMSGKAIVSSVRPGSAAENAGVQRGDVITAVDEKPVSDPASCLSLINAHQGSRGILLFIERNGMKTTAVLDPASEGKPPRRSGTK